MTVRCLSLPLERGTSEALLTLSIDAWVSWSCLMTATVGRAGHMSLLRVQRTAYPRVYRVQGQGRDFVVEIEP